MSLLSSLDFGWLHIFQKYFVAFERFLMCSSWKSQFSLQFEIVVGCRNTTVLVILRYNREVLMTQPTFVNAENNKDLYFWNCSLLK